MSRNLTNPGLKDLQAMLYRLITAPEGVAAGLAAERAKGPEALADLHDLNDLENVIESDDRLSAVERLEIYANAYFYRILDCLKEDFPATLAIVGGDNFHNLVTGYLIEYPPTEPSISYAGRYLAEFLLHHPMRAMRERWPFIAELARLERALTEVFHAAEAEPLNADAMRSVAPDDWPTIAMRTHPALAIVDCQWRVDELLRKVETAASETDQPRDAARAAVSVLVWRHNSKVHYRALERPERAALEVASAGASFAAICEAVAAACAEDDSIAPVALINRLLARWIDEGLLVLAGA
ncbi:MAG TPA: DNA-binding domain-containing protein [Candidatus Binataceae bacterium]|nr:DNA-binding domain-containing protein [Candidatus Binataceae bacterium]